VSKATTFTLAGCLAVVVASSSVAAPVVTMTQSTLVRQQSQGAGTYKALDFSYTNSPGAEFSNYRLIVEAISGNLMDPAKLQDDRQIINYTNEDNTGGSVDTFANTVWSAVGRNDFDYRTSHIIQTGSYVPSGSGAAAPFTFMDWSVSDTLQEDDNDLNDAFTNGPVAATAPYFLARILATPAAAGTVQFLAFDTSTPGQPTVFDFTFGPGTSTPTVVDHVVGPPYNTDEPGAPQTLTHQFQATDVESPNGPFAWDLLTLQSYTPNYGAQNEAPLPTGPLIAPTLTGDGLFSWISEGSPFGDYVWQVRATNPGGQSDFGTITVHANPILLMGDYNLDTIVDTADYVVWRKSVGDVVPRCSGGDANCNGFVENLDIHPWKASYGHTLAAGATSRSNSHVPEPSWVVLLVTAVLTTGGVRTIVHRDARDIGPQLASPQRLMTLPGVVGYDECRPTADRRPFAGSASCWEKGANLPHLSTNLR
jgi:hypothetical protein